MLSHKDRQLIALSCLPRMGVKSLAKLIDLGGQDFHQTRFKINLSSVQRAAFEEFLAGNSPINKRLDRVMNLMEQHNIGFCSFFHKSYPPQLKQIYDPPLYLFYKGDIAVASSNQIAVVGSRKASTSGLQHAYCFAQSLAGQGLVVTSGLAQGVDAAAHKGAVDIGRASVAVMGAGLDMIYPKSNIQLASAILQDGCWLSEYLPGSKPIAANFPRRNRIISGLALGVLVVEARLKSGTLITARMAVEQNREVFAIPGSIDFAGSSGCHALITSGACLVAKPEDILTELDLAYKLESKVESDKSNEVGSKAEPINLKAFSSVTKSVYQALDYQPRSIEQVAMICCLPVNAVSSSLSELELEGLAITQGSNFLRRG